MAGGRTPIDQLDSLPLLSAAQWVSGVVPQQGTVTIVNGKITKIFDPVATGINGTLANVADPRTAGRYYAITNWLDFTALVTLTAVLVLKVTQAGGDAAAQVWSVLYIPAQDEVGGVIDPTPTLPGPSNNNMTGDYGGNAFPQVGILNSVVLNAARNLAGPYPYFKMLQVSFAAGIALGGTLTQFGVGVHKIWLSSTTAAPNNCEMYLTIWGQG